MPSLKKTKRREEEEEEHEEDDMDAPMDGEVLRDHDGIIASDAYDVYGGDVTMGRSDGPRLDLGGCFDERRCIGELDGVGDS